MRALWIAAGAVVWALHFTAIYAVTAIACARGAAHIVPWSIAAATAIAAGLAIAVIASRYRNRAEFIDWMALAVAAAALIAIVWEALAVLWLPACGGVGR